MDASRSRARTSLRLWPGIVAVVVQWLLWVVVPIAAPALTLYATIGGVVCGVAVVAWWLLFSRAPWAERGGALVVMVLGVAATSFVVHESISNGMMGMMLPFYAIPALSLALVAWAVVARGFSIGMRRATMVMAILLACSVFTLIRTGGITGEGDSDLHWRWTPTPEERLLATTPLVPAAPPQAPRPSAPSAAPAPASSAPSAALVPGSSAPSAPSAALAPGSSAPSAPSAALASPSPSSAASSASWPGFRGPARDSAVHGVRIEADWSRKPPVELWRRPIGPGWSSFAVQGDLVYTQEQRGEDEVVSCYTLSTGKPVWQHRDPIRFWESNGGAGPRATPTLANGRVYTMGATGLLNALDARTGAVRWSRNAATDTGKDVPDWGIASSPLVLDDLVIVAAAGRLAAYDVETGELRWLGQPGGGGYSSPHLATIDGVRQVLLARGSRTTSVAPSDGSLLWEHVGEPSVAIVQPALVGGGSVLVAPADAMGGISMRRLAVSLGPSGWTVTERWASRGLKPYFNDFVVHRGHAFGFDGSILACIDLETGERVWKGGRYGHGQMVLLSDEDLLLVLSEDGELVLVSATPDKFTEVARVPALTGKTWNHPVLAGDVLLVRNGEEMAAFRLSMAVAASAARH